MWRVVITVRHWTLSIVPSGSIPTTQRQDDVCVCVCHVCVCVREFSVCGVCGVCVCVWCLCVCVRVWCSSVER